MELAFNVYYGNKSLNNEHSFLRIESATEQVKEELKLHSVHIKEMWSAVNLRLALSNELETTMAFKFE